MKVVGIVSLFISCVVARGSGPYLPSGWKPDGPAFFLPSEIPKPSNEPLKEVIFSESEASGSDFLREYGPPKLQGLPDVVNEQLFTETIVETNDAEKNPIVVAEVAVDKLEVNAEVKTFDETSVTTEPQLVVETETLTNIEEEVANLSDETISKQAKSLDAVDDFGYLVEPTAAIVGPTEIISEIVTEDVQLTNQQQESEGPISQLEESGISDAIQITSRSQQSDSIVSEQADTQQTDLNFDVISSDEIKIEANEEKAVGKAAQNIPELLVNLENEIRTQQAQTIQQVPAVIQENSGSLDAVPESFLEYGPPGFQEYGPPKEDLTDNTIEEKTSGKQLIVNSERRRRRFSPKFRSTLKSH